MANSLWLTDRETFRDAFQQTNKQYFDAALRTVNMGDPATVPAMNDWVKQQTQGMIPKLVEDGDVTNQTVLVLLNALYFKGAWMTYFDPLLTTDQPFTTGDGTTLTVKMMQRLDKWQYYQDDQLQMVRLPYKNGAMSMLIILPRTGQTLDTIARTVFSATNWPY